MSVIQGENNLKLNSKPRHSRNTKRQAKVLRREGYTHREISLALGISLGSAHLWTVGIRPTAAQKEAIEDRRRKRNFTKEERAETSLRLAPFREKYSREDLLQKIITFCKQHGRIPLKREFNMWHEYRRHFKSWNHAIVAAGFKPNNVIFSKKFIAKDGHRCDSYAEKIIDDWLYSHKINHERHVHYAATKMTADFAIGNVRVEYFGLKGVSTTYDKNIAIKRKLCKQLGLSLLEITPAELFAGSTKSFLKKIFQNIKPPTQGRWIH